MVQESMAQNSQEHLQKMRLERPETAAEMHGENLQGPKEEPEALPPHTTIEEPPEDALTTPIAHQPNDEDRTSGTSEDSSTHDDLDKEDEQDLPAQDIAEAETPA